MRNRKAMAAAIAAIMTMAMSFQAMAGEWKQNEIGWWWQEEDGSYPVNSWQWLDGNKVCMFWMSRAREHS